MAVWLRVVLSVSIFCVLTVTAGPFLIPVRPLPELLPAERLADPDSRFVELNGLKVHYKIAGSGEPLIILLHGFSANTYSWRKVMKWLSAPGTVVAYDRPASGLTERPLDETLRRWPGDNPYGADAQADHGDLR